ncbi:hypothetical protein [Pseudactinotalea sp. Z1748]|uniref:hypothetical protein n=1 Tax=Pseudactinotalea sp. Z1748 TaxID=3413027 RepID=UPI003C7C5CC7
MSIDTYNTPGPFEAGTDPHEDQGDFDATDEVDQDRPEQVEEDQDENHQEEQAAQSGAKTKSRKRSGPDRALIRRVATKSAELAQASDADVELLATLLGSPTETVELTVAVMTASRGAVSALSDVKDLAAADGAERAVLAMTMGRPRMKSLWAVLEHLGAVSGSLAASDAKAALALAEVDVDQDQMGQLDRVADLAKRA